MDHKKIKELVQLYACDELKKKEIEIVEDHLLECDECSAEYSSMKQLYFAFTENAPAQVENHLVNQARENLMDTIREQSVAELKSSDSFFDKIINLISSPVRLSLSGVAMVIFGVFIGKLLLSPALPALSGGVNIDNLDFNSVDVANVKFLPSSNNSNQVEIMFNNVTPVVYKGEITDSKVQNLLARAIVAGNNPGVRIKSVSAIAERATKNSPIDKSVKKALIEALKVDHNAGVRKQALNVLVNYPLDKDIQDAFLFVLSNDKNPGMRVMAINALGELQSAGNPITGELFDLLSTKAESDNNSFVRLKAANLIEGKK
ncbi:MAG: hypothetical protein ACEPO8_05080 [Rhodothermaceae bacterium]